MGILTDLIIANKSEVEDILNSSAPLSKWRGFDAKGHNDLTLGILLSVLREEKYNLDTIIDEFPLLAQTAKCEAFVLEVPDELMSLLNQLDDARVSDIVSKWLETEDMQAFNYNVLETFIKEFKRLSVDSVIQQKPVLMWISL